MTVHALPRKRKFPTPVPPIPKREPQPDLRRELSDETKARLLMLAVMRAVPWSRG